MDGLRKYKPSRIVILRALMLGDLLCAVPAFRAVRRAFPEAEIVLAGLPWARAFADRFPEYFNGFIEFPGFPGLPEQNIDASRILGFLQEMQCRKFDWALQMHGSGSFVNPLVMLFGARMAAGFYTKGDYCPNENTFLVYPENEPEIRRHLKLMTFLDVPLQGEDLEFPLTDEDKENLAKLDETRNLETGRYVCIHPGARYASRRWIPARFAQVGDILFEAGFQVVLTGSAAETELTESVANAMTAPCINLAGKTSLGTLGGLLEGSRLVVTNDTGVSHVAAALKVPSVVIVLGSDPFRWAPLDRERHAVVSHPIDCQPCPHVKCPIGFPCAHHLSAEKVAEKSLEMLSRLEYSHA